MQYKKLNFSAEYVKYALIVNEKFICGVDNNDLLCVEIVWVEMFCPNGGGSRCRRISDIDKCSYPCLETEMEKSPGP